LKVLLDTCVWGGAADELRSLGHDVTWTGSWDEDPGDEEILALAWREERVLVTLDKDFGEMVVVRNHPHRGILRLVGFAARRQGAACAQIFESHGEELLGGALVTAEPGRLRMRPPTASGEGG
jgi:predicted nuclease of predicted toxin-antitoxin system